MLRWVAWAMVRRARRDIVFDMDDFSRVIQPDHVQRDQCIFHPERVRSAFLEDKQHPAVGIKRRAKLQPAVKFLLFLNHFPVNPFSPEADRGGRPRGRPRKSPKKKKKKQETRNKDY